jgi:hypothetical protein
VQAKTFSVVGDANQTMARALTHSLDYHTEKGKIMSPIDKFAHLSAERIALELELLSQQAILILVILGTMLLLLVLLVILVAVWSSSEEEKRAIRIATKASSLARRVAAELRKYNTERCQEIVDESRQDPEGNQELMDSFEALRENLEKYRPFLPNYLFQDEDSSAEGEEGDIPVESESGDGSQPHTAKGAPSSTGKSSSRTSRAGAAYGGTLLQTSTKRDHCRQAGAISFALVDVCVGRLAQLVVDPAASLLGTVTTAPNTRRGSSAREATLAVLQATVDAIYKLAKETKASVHSMLGDTVQLTWNATSNTAMPETKGAVFLAHLLRWSRHDASAVGCVLSAAICSGPATVYSLLSHNQQALLIDADWLPALEGCLDLAKQHNQQVVHHHQDDGGLEAGVVLMDERTMATAQMQVKSCAVEKLFFLPTTGATDPRSAPYDTTPVELLNTPQPPVCSMSPPQPPSSTPVVAGPKCSFLCHYPYHPQPSASSSFPTTAVTVYQILGEREDAEDEWMYQLQRHDSPDGGSIGTTGTEAEAGPTAAVALQAKAVAACVEGRFEDALLALRRVQELNHDLVTTKTKNKKSTRDEVSSSPLFTDLLADKCHALLHAAAAGEKIDL